MIEQARGPVRGTSKIEPESGQRSTEEVFSLGTLLVPAPRDDGQAVRRRYRA